MFPLAGKDQKLSKSLSLPLSHMAPDPFPELFNSPLAPAVSFIRQAEGSRSSPSSPALRQDVPTTRHSPTQGIYDIPGQPGENEVSRQSMRTRGERSSTCSLEVWYTLPRLNFTFLAGRKLVYIWIYTCRGENIYIIHLCDLINVSKQKSTFTEIQKILMCIVYNPFQFLKRYFTYANQKCMGSWWVNYKEMFRLRYTCI